MKKEKSSRKKSNIFFKIFGYFILINGIWTNGFMFGAIDRIIKETSRSEFNIHFMITFFLIIGGIKFIKISKAK